MKWRELGFSNATMCMAWVALVTISEARELSPTRTFVDTFRTHMIEDTKEHYIIVEKQTDNRKYIEREYSDEIDPKDIEGKDKDSIKKDENVDFDDNDDDSMSLLWPALRGSLWKTDESVKASVIDVIFSKLLQFYMPSTAPRFLPEENKTDCHKDTSIIQASEIAYYPWIIEMVDSWGKIPDGFFFGNVHSMGMYEECQALSANFNYSYKYNKTTTVTVPRSFEGKYCSIHYKRVNVNSTSTMSSPTSERSSVVLTLNRLPYSYATCIPSSCTSEELWVSLNETALNANMKVVSVICSTLDEPEEDLRLEDKAVLSMLGILAGLLVVATVYDITTEQTDSNDLRQGVVSRVFISFSFVYNMRKIFTYKDTKGTITCLTAMRVITMSWIIICHQYETGVDFAANTLDAAKYQDPVMGQVVTNGWLSVDTFLFMTGLVLTYKLLPAITKKRTPNPLSFVKLFVRRFFRLSPSIFVVAAVAATVLRFLARGPRAYLLQEYVEEECAPHWWKDPLFINNYLFGDQDGLTVHDCLSHCWYTAVDMQLLLILPLILFAFTLGNKVVGVVFLSVLTLGSILVPMTIILVNDLPPTPLHVIPVALKFEYMWRVYLTPWCRAGPWLVGVWTALALSHPTVSKVNLHKVVVVLGYVVAITLGLILVLVLYPYNHVMPTDDYTQAVAASYASLARPAWGVCLAWVVFTCQTGNAKMVNRFMSYPGWRPLGRMCFAIYLLSPLVALWWTTTLYFPVYFNYLAKLFESLGVIFVSGLVGLFLMLLVELPVSNLLNLAFASSKEEKPAAVENRSEMFIDKQLYFQ